MDQLAWPKHRKETNWLDGPRLSSKFMVHKFMIPWSGILVRKIIGRYGADYGLTARSSMPLNPQFKNQPEVASSIPKQSFAISLISYPKAIFWFA